MPDQDESHTKVVENARRTFLLAAGRLTLDDEPAGIYHVEPYLLADDSSDGDEE
jgi:hypothetical protein